MKQGWDLKKLSDTGKIFNGNSINEKFKKDNYIGLNDGYPFIATKDIGFDNEIDYDNGVKIPFTEKAKYKIAPSNIPLICAEGGSAGRKIGFTNQDVCFGNKLFAFVPNKNIESKFIYYYYFHSSFQKYFRTEMTGIIGGISVNKFKEIEIPIPPLQEQQRIVSILDDAFAKIEKAKANAEQNLKNAKELFESYLQGVFEKKGDDWEEKSLGEIGKPSMCKRILKKQTSSIGDVPFYKIGTFGKSPDAYISQEIYDEYRTKYSFPKKGDILISASGTIGRRVRYNGEPAFFQDSNIVWIDNDEKQVLNDYLYVFYEFCDWQPSKGATISRLYNKNLTSIKIVFPKSIKEQVKLLEKINTLSTKTKHLEVNYKQKLTDLEELKKSILNKAFNGEL